MKISRPIKYEEFIIMLARFEIMILDGNKLTIEEFLEQENKRRNIFNG